MQLPVTVSRCALAGLVLATAGLAWWAWPGAEAVAPEPVAAIARQRPVPVAPTLALAVDASDLTRGLLHATVSWPAAPGRLQLRFPRWIQGTHAPSGVAANLVNLAMRDGGGAPLAWSRDPLDLHRFAVEVPAGGGIAISLSYIANQPTENSQGVDVLAKDGVAMINWNNALLYPEGWPDTALQITATMRLPRGWLHASALAAGEGAGGAIAFATTDLRTLIDSPVLCGRALAIHKLPVAGFAPHRLAVAAPRSLGDPPERATAQLAAIAAEARELWGAAPFASYTWLLALGNDMPRHGLEHLASSANGLKQDDWFDGDGIEAGAAFLLGHEYGHVWIGKHHRPAGMLVADCHSDLDTRLLWVYEGFDQYLGMILAARSGAVGRAVWLERVGGYIEHIHGGRSRTWRTLEDTAAASQLLRDRSGSWQGLRGGQDYYLEGMLLCFEADGLIRRASGGARSFDQVLARLFPTRGVGEVHPFGEDDVVAALRSVEPSIDWPALIARRVRATGAGVDPDALAAWGMRLRWQDSRPDDGRNGYLDDSAFIGLRIWQGRIIEVVPGSPADAARLAQGATILKVGGVPFTPATWDAGLAAVPPGGALHLTVRRAPGEVAEVMVACPVKPRYLIIEPSEEPADKAILDAILAPRSAEGRAVRAGSGDW